MNFEEIWERIKSETDLKNLSDLARLVGTSQPFLSKKKKQNYFATDWAYKVGRRYNLLTEWILTGEGPKRLANLTYRNCNLSVIECDVNSQKNRKLSSDLIQDLDTWVSEMLALEPDRADWIKHCIYDALPTFKEWRKRKESDDIDEGYYPQGKVA